MIILSAVHLSRTNRNQSKKSIRWDENKIQERCLLYFINFCLLISLTQKRRRDENKSHEEVNA